MQAYCKSGNVLQWPQEVPLYKVSGNYSDSQDSCYLNTSYSSIIICHTVLQSIVTPNGLIANLFGPVEGRRHDAFMLAESNLLQELETGDFRNYCLYGDPAYPLRPVLMAPYRGAVLSPEEQQFNTTMAKLRQAVEWGFQKVVVNFAFLDFKKNLKLYLQPIGVYYSVGVILTNIHTCLYSSQTSEYFGCPTPTVEEYLS